MTSSNGRRRVPVPGGAAGPALHAHHVIYRNPPILGRGGLTDDQAAGVVWHHQVVNQHREPEVREALSGTLEQIAELIEERGQRRTLDDQWAGPITGGDDPLPPAPALPLVARVSSRPGAAPGSIPAAGPPRPPIETS